VSVAASIAGPDYETYEVSIDIIGHIVETMIISTLIQVAGFLGAATLTHFFSVAGSVDIADSCYSSFGVQIMR
jgi:hypothetical protein